MSERPRPTVPVIGNYDLAPLSRAERALYPLDVVATIGTMNHRYPVTLGRLRAFHDELDQMLAEMTGTMVTCGSNADVPQ